MYFEILKELYEKGLFIEGDITHFFSGVVNIPWKSKEEQIKDFVEDMAENGHITYSITPDRIKASITLMGFDYYKENEVREQTIASLKSQGWSNRVTWSIALFAIFLSTGTSIILGISNNSLDKRVLQLEQTQKPIIKKEKVLSPPPKHIDTPPQIGG